MSTPTDNLVRVVDIEPVGLREAGEGSSGRTLFGHFAVFNEWTEINSMWEGRFRERIAPGAFARTIKERFDRVKVLFDHGKDPQLGNKPLGKIKTLREDERGVYYEVELLDVPYVNEFVLPAVRAGLLGASFRFSVASEGEEWERGQDGMDERTITDMDLFEFGPVTFPAYDAATAGVRSGTDDFLDRLAQDPRFVARFTERAGLAVTERLIEALESISSEKEGNVKVTLSDGEFIVPASVTDQAARGLDYINEKYSEDNVTDYASGGNVDDTEERETEAPPETPQTLSDDAASTDGQAKSYTLDARKKAMRENYVRLMRVGKMKQ